MSSQLRYAQDVRCGDNADGISLPYPVMGNRDMRNHMHVVGTSLPEAEGMISACQEVVRERLVELLKQTGEGSKSAFEELYTLTSPKLYLLVYGILRSSGEAEDVLQGIYVTIWQRADQFDPHRGTAMIWLISLARNKSINRLRQSRKTTDDETNWGQIVDERATSPGVADMSQGYRRLGSCIRKLEGCQCGVIAEAFYTGVTYAEPVACLSVSVGMTKSWVRRNLLQLKMCLEQQS